MKERGILFSAPMVLALRREVDPKQVTRRLDPRWKKVRAGDRLWTRETWAAPHKDKKKQGRVAYNSDGVCGCWCGQGEDRTFVYHGRVLQADGYRQCFPPGGASTFSLGEYSDVRSGEYPSYKYGWRPCLFMPRWASRDTLEVLEDTREERLQDITEEDARLEGVEPCGCSGRWRNYGAAPHAAINHYADPRDSFKSLWESLHTKAGERWDDNPTVYRVGKFRRIAA